ncbi:MAG: tRNA pseudouridine(38-40) synthase TruA [Chloroflexi bacterium]|nr:tRNA pseudouridine(38-40) synthase TruA [Chloroflexota bacterium]
MSLKKIVLFIEYDGSNYHGFQLQKNANTIQNEIEQALKKLTNESIRIIGASRTDTGVHAKEQVVCFRTKSKLSPETFLKGLNYYLPKDIAVKAAYKVFSDFRLRREITSREYQYLILNSKTPSPLKRNRVYLVTTSLNVEGMNEASKSLIGKHDFSSFTVIENLSNTIRTVFTAEVLKKDDLLIFKVIADAFLQQQIRRTVGALIQVGTGKINVESFVNLLNLKVKGLAGPTAPPYGLCLTAVNFKNDFLRYKSEDL